MDILISHASPAAYLSFPQSPLEEAELSEFRNLFNSIEFSDDERLFLESLVSEEITLQDVAKKLKISESRACQIRNGLCERIRHRLRFNASPLRHTAPRTATRK